MSDVKEFKSTQELISEVHSLRKAVDGGEVSRSELLTKIDKVNDALKDQRAEVTRLAESAQARQIASGTEADVTRAYVPSDREKAAINKRLVTNGTGRLQRMHGNSAGSVYLGGEGGIVKLLGHEDECGDYEYGLFDDPAPKSEWQKSVQECVTDIGFCNWFGTPARRSMKRLHKLMKRGPEPIAKTWSDNAGEGAEFIADVLVPDLIRELRLPTGGVAALFETMQSRVGGTTTNPFMDENLQPFQVGQPSSGDNDPATIERSNMSTGSRTYAPKTWGVNLPVFMDAEEDSIIEFGPMARASIAAAFRDGLEDAIINGDTAATHFHTGINTWAGPNGRWGVVGSTNDHRKSWIGLTAAADDASSKGSETSNQTVAGTMLWRSNLTGAHRSLSNLAYIMPLGFLIAKLLTDSNFLTIDKYGSLATILTGEIGRIGGVPVVVSEYMSEELNTSGVFDDSTKTKTAGLLVNRSRFQIVQRRGPMMTVEPRPTQHTNYLVASVRQTFRNLDTSSTKNVYYGYNIDFS